MHHGPDLGEATTFPLIVYSMPLHETNTQMAFGPGIPKVGTPATLGPHNFVWKLPIEMRSKQSCSSHQELSNTILHATYTL
jgi:hypothetical protein